MMSVSVDTKAIRSWVCGPLTLVFAPAHSNVSVRRENVYGACLNCWLFTVQVGISVDTE